jgi:hypothetical protein
MAHQSWEQSNVFEKGRKYKRVASPQVPACVALLIDMSVAVLTNALSTMTKALEIGLVRFGIRVINRRIRLWSSHPLWAILKLGST